MKLLAAPRLSATVPLALIVTLIVVAYRFILELDFLGDDTLPMILTSRIHSLDNLVQVLTTELMAGRFTHEFYRPVTSLTLAFDWAVWGLNPFGFHLTDLMLLGGAATAVYFAAQRLFSPGWLPTVAALSFALHPVHLAAIPVTARRADYASLMLTLLAVCALPPTGTRPLAARGGLCAVLVLGAMGAKETGLAAVIPLVALALAESWRRSSVRLRHALRPVAFPLTVAVLFVVVRLAVLDGIGGYEQTSITDAFSRFGATLRHHGSRLLIPQSLTGRADLDTLARWLLAASMIGAVGLLMVARDIVGTSRRRSIGSLWVLACWVCALTFVTAASGPRFPWYTVPFLPAYAMTFAFITTGAAQACRHRPARVAVPLTVIACSLAWAHLRYSSLFHDYVEWREISRHTESFFSGARVEISQLAEGEVVVLNNLPRRVPSNRARAAPGVSGLAARSVEAWAELAFPDRPVRVTYADQERSRPAGRGQVVVEMTLRGRDRAP